MANSKMQGRDVSTGPIGPLIARSGNVAAERPTRMNPIACDCCDKETDYLNSGRSCREVAFGSLPYVICKECCQNFGYEDLSREQTTKFIIRRAARFGTQWEEAVKAQLGWPA